MLLECRRFLSVRISLPIRRVAIAQPSEPPRDVRVCMKIQKNQVRKVAATGARKGSNIMLIL